MRAFKSRVMGASIPQIYLLSLKEKINTSYIHIEDFNLIYFFYQGVIIEIHDFDYTLYSDKGDYLARYPLTFI